MSFLVVVIFAVIGYSIYSGTQDSSNTDTSSTDTGNTDTSNTGDTSMATPFIQAWADITAKFENVTASTNSAAAQDSNNPGGVYIAPGSSIASEVTGVTGQIAAPGAPITTFDSLADGQAALQTVLQNYVANHPNLNIVQAISRYITGNAGSGVLSDYSSGIQARAQALANAVGASVSDTIGSL